MLGDYAMLSVKLRLHGCHKHWQDKEMGFVTCEASGRQSGLIVGKREDVP
jgi:hypothetical protein